MSPAGKNERCQVARAATLGVGVGLCIQRIVEAYEDGPVALLASWSRRWYVDAVLIPSDCGPTFMRDHSPGLDSETLLHRWQTADACHGEGYSKILLAEEFGVNTNSRFVRKRYVAYSRSLFPS